MLDGARRENRLQSLSRVRAQEQRSVHEPPLSLIAVSLTDREYFELAENGTVQANNASSADVRTV